MGVGWHSGGRGELKGRWVREELCQPNRRGSELLMASSIVATKVWDTRGMKKVLLFLKEIMTLRSYST